MKAFLFLICAAALGYFAYEHWSGPAPDPPPVTVEAPAESPVSFSVKMRVKRLISEWQRFSLARSKGETDSALAIMGVEFHKVRETLHRDGMHDEGSLRREMERAAVELGKAPDQAAHLVEEILSAVEDESGHRDP